MELLDQARNAILGRFENPHEVEDIVVLRRLEHPHEAVYNNDDDAYNNLEEIHRFLRVMWRWKLFHFESNESQWARFQESFLLDDSSWLEQDQRSINKAMKQFRKNDKAGINLLEGEMCANCSILETQSEQGGLWKCARCCCQIKYCSRKCQVEHWNKGHKNHCERVKYYYSSSSPLVESRIAR